MPLLKKLFWAYFLLLIFEGGLRKWILPQLSAPLLLVRDPVAVFIIWEAYRTHKWPKQWSVVTGILAAVLLGLFLAQMIAGENPWFAGLYGLRSYLLPFPVAFIMGENLDAEDLRKFGTCILWLALPLVALEVAQYSAAPKSPLNTGAYQGAEQIGYSGGHVRASATFSYVAGPINYFPLAAAFIFYGLVMEKFARRWLLWAASFAVILAVPVTGSRTMAYQLGAVLACVGIAAVFGVSQFTKSLKLIVPFLVVSFLVSLLPVFSDATDTLLQRFTDANASEGGTENSLLLRVLEPVTGTIGEADLTGSWLGLGMGHGAAAITTLLGGSVEFLAGEYEFPRVLNEFGAPVGFVFMLFRISLGVMIVAKALSRVRDHQPLAWLLVPTMFGTLAYGILEQPTNQGFLVISVAFSLAALKLTKVSPETKPVQNPRWVQPRNRLYP
jgi:hypothetical protein